MIEKATPGQPSPFRKASNINPVLEATNDFQQRKALGGSRSKNSITHDGCRVHVKNDTGGNMPRGSVLQLGALVYDAIDPANLAFVADVPADPVTDKYAILSLPIPDGKIGPAQAAGVCVALVDVLDVDHTRAIPVAGESVLSSAESGPIELLSPPDGTGEQLMAVRLAVQERPPLIGKTDATHAKGSSGTISIYSGTKGSETDTGVNVEAWNRFADLGSGKWVTLLWIGEGYDLIAGEC
jgi:hypothetical protein